MAQGPTYSPVFPFLLTSFFFPSYCHSPGRRWRRRGRQRAGEAVGGGRSCLAAQEGAETGLNELARPRGRMLIALRTTSLKQRYIRIPEFLMQFTCMAGQGSQKKKSCDWSKRYVDHLNGKMKCFHLQMSANFGHSMTIPNKFLDHFGGTLSRTIELVSPKGIMYIVKVTEHMNKTILQCGWEAFVDAHHIEENDSLLFRHIENSRFEVLILDSDGCEKVFTCAGIKKTSSVQERNAAPVDISRSTHDETTQSSGSKKFVRCQRASDSQRGKTAKLAETSSSGESGEEGTDSSTSEDESSYELDDPQMPPGRNYVLSRWTSLSEAQEEKVDMLVQDIQPEIPVFVAIMKHSNVNSRRACLVIPKRYASAHFPLESQTITLQRQGKNKKWYPMFYIRKDGSGYMLYGCWKNFVRDNHVKEGDMCIFHLTKFTGGEFGATVHLLRETKSGSLGSFHTSHKRFDLRDGRTWPKVTGVRRVSSRPYLTADRVSLTEEQVRKVEEVVHSIQSEGPMYVSIMNKSNVGTDGLYIIIFGRQFATRYLPEGEQTLTLLMTGKSNAWQVKMRPRSGDAQMITTGWRHFVHDNHLQIEDICLFQLMNDETNQISDLASPGASLGLGKLGTHQASSSTSGPEKRNCCSGKSPFKTTIPNPEMKKYCDCCKRYVDHSNGKMKCFHRQMSANFEHSMFLDQFGGKISRTVELESPKGNVYVVKVSKHMNKTVLQCGWEAFVDAHQIEENDSLLFRHIENSRRASGVQERNADPIDVSSSTHDDTVQSSGGERFARSESGSDSQHREEAKESSSSEHESSYDLVDPQIAPMPGYVLSRGTNLSQAHEEKLDMLVQEIRPEIPLYVTTMKHSNVNSHHASLVIAKHYACAYFPHTSQTITLKWHGKNRKWHPKFYIRKDQVGYILHGRWIDFVRHNHVKEGDICIFHLKNFNGRKFRATVHLLRETIPHSFGALHIPKRFESRNGRMRLKMTDDRRVSSTECRRGTMEPSTTNVKKEADNEQCNNGQGKRQEPLNFDVSVGSSKPYLTADRVSLTEEQFMKVEENVHSIQSEGPIYVSIMNKSNVGTDGLYIITLGRQFAIRYLPEGEQTLTLLTTGTGKAWQVKMRPRSGDARMFTLGWRDFVRDNRLQTEDICLFQLMKNSERGLAMKVHIIRHNERS
uniref:TF-B3 domain-containing protein n=1 Tax=Oryza rufipogon TaxID=4529 RepID=A0A0E0NYB9_ORYRU